MAELSANMDHLVLLEWRCTLDWTAKYEKRSSSLRRGLAKVLGCERFIPFNVEVRIRTTVHRSGDSSFEIPVRAYPRVCMTKPVPRAKPSQSHPLYGVLHPEHGLKLAAVSVPPRKCLDTSGIPKTSETEPLAERFYIINQVLRDTISDQFGLLRVPACFMAPQNEKSSLKRGRVIVDQ